MRSLMIAMLLLSASASVAAEVPSGHRTTFTFTSTTTQQNAVSGRDGAAPVIAVFSSSSVSTTYVTGPPVASTGSCASWLTLRTLKVPYYGVCVSTDTNGNTISNVFVCRPINSVYSVFDCTGVLTGTAGSVAGKTGAAYWTSSTTATGSSSSGSGHILN